VPSPRLTNVAPVYNEASRARKGGSGWLARLGQPLRARFLLVAGALVIGILLIYAPVRTFEFINFDDPSYVSDNPAVRDGLTPAGLAWAFSSFEATN
jgi:hypothetical protein